MANPCHEAGGHEIAAAEILAGIENGEFFLGYQPQFSLIGNRRTLDGVEALVRWNHPKHGVLLPSRFLSAVSSAGLICDLGRFVTEEAARQIRLWLERTGWSPRVSTNVAPEQLAQADSSTDILRTLRKFGVPATYVEVELVESEAITDLEFASRSLRTLQAAGATVALDDFGTGFSSFNYLLHLPIDTIKICPTFVGKIGRGTGADEICKAVIRLGQSLHKKVIAEGVETLPQLTFLQGHMCDAAQGFLLGRPMSPENIAKHFHR